MANRIQEKLKRVREWRKQIHSNPLQNIPQDFVNDIQISKAGQSEKKL
jgi:predicted small metal-binding protein